MKPGSLVTPRWPEELMLQELARYVRRERLSLVHELPEYGQLYTVKYVGPIVTHVARPEHHVLVDELTVFPAEVTTYKTEIGLPPEFYVEVDPPQENVQSIVDQIIIEAPVEVLVF